MIFSLPNTSEIILLLLATGYSHKVSPESVCNWALITYQALGKFNMARQLILMQLFSVDVTISTAERKTNAQRG